MPTPFFTMVFLLLTRTKGMYRKLRPDLFSSVVITEPCSYLAQMLGYRHRQSKKGCPLDCSSAVFFFPIWDRCKQNKLKNLYFCTRSLIGKKKGSLSALGKYDLPRSVKYGTPNKRTYTYIARCCAKTQRRYVDRVVWLEACQQIHSIQSAWRRCSVLDSRRSHLIYKTQKYLSSKKYPMPQTFMSASLYQLTCRYYHDLLHSVIWSFGSLTLRHFYYSVTDPTTSFSITNYLSLSLPPFFPSALFVILVLPCIR